MPESSAMMMIEIAMAGHARKGQDIQFWFDRATKSRLDYYPAYSGHALGSAAASLGRQP